jgi:hypothetical protein
MDKIVLIKLYESIFLLSLSLRIAYLNGWYVERNKKVLGEKRVMVENVKMMYFS